MLFLKQNVVEVSFKSQIRWPKNCSSFQFDTNGKSMVLAVLKEAAHVKSKLGLRCERWANFGPLYFGLYFSIFPFNNNFHYFILHLTYFLQRIKNLVPVGSI